MITAQQKEKARLFQAMHKSDKMLIIPNAWDVGSAYIFAQSGFPAIATSSAGIAYSMGYPDGEVINCSTLIKIVQQITSRISVPVSVDFERGYSDDITVFKNNCRAVLEAGAVGLNIEDGLLDGTLSPLSLQLAKITALKELKKELNLDFVINARTCTYWLQISSEEEMLQTAIMRGNAFAKAGADCIFIPGPMTEGIVQQLVSHINAPVNIILNGIFHDLKQLEALGVRRLSIGSAPARSIYNQTIQLAADLAAGKVDTLLSTSFTYAKANKYFSNK